MADDVVPPFSAVSLEFWYFELIVKLLGILNRAVEAKTAESGWSGVSCLLNLSLFFFALSSFFSEFSAMLTCFLSPANLV